MGISISNRLDEDIRDEFETQGRADGVSLAIYLHHLTATAALEAKCARIRQASHKSASKLPIRAP